MSEQKNVNIDIIRCVALCFVISIHFIGQIEFHEVIFHGMDTLFASCIKNIFMQCVPLFLLITGYLMSEKKLTYSYKFFRRIVELFVIYAFATLLIFVIRSITISTALDIKFVIRNILSYQQYAWYVNMYIGLYLLMPFLNLLWSSIADKKTERNLLIVLFIATILPSLLNTYSIGNLDWWVKPSTSNMYDQIIPDYWEGIWPIMYYFIGAYIKKHQVKMGVLKNVVIWFSCIIIFGIYNYYRSYGGYYVPGKWCDFYGFEAAITSTLFFILLLGINTKNIPIMVKKVLSWIARYSFGAYIISYIWDQIVYAQFNAIVEGLGNRMLFLVPITFVVIVLSLLSSFFVTQVSCFVLKAVEIVFLKRKNRNKSV